MPEGAILASFDIVSLYTSINHDRGLRAMKNCLTNSDFSDSVKGFLVSLIEIVLTCNYFVFEGQYYLQLKGTAMGAIMAPT